MFDLDPNKKKVNFAHNHIFQVIPREQKCICKNRELHELSIHTNFKNLLIHNGFLYAILIIVKQIREVHKKKHQQLGDNLQTAEKHTQK